MTCLHNHDQILEFLRKIFLKGFQIYQNYLCALSKFNLCMVDCNYFLSWEQFDINEKSTVSQFCECKLCDPASQNQQKVA